MLKFSTSVNFLFSELPFLERFAAAATNGFAGVEMQFLEAPVPDIRLALDDSGVKAVLINVEMGDLLSGGPGLSGVPGREGEGPGAPRPAEIPGDGVAPQGDSRHSSATELMARRSQEGAQGARALRIQIKRIVNNF